MKASELIERLQALLNEHGDGLVTIPTDQTGGQYADVEDVQAFQAEAGHMIFQLD